MSEKKITLDPDLIADPATELKPVAAQVTVSGSPKTICVLASEAFSTGSGTGSSLPSNAGKSKWMVLTLSADNTGADNPALWTVNWMRWA